MTQTVPSKSTANVFYQGTARPRVPQAVLPKNVSVKGSAMINPKQTWRPKGAYLDSVNRDNGSYTLKQFEAIQKKISRVQLFGSQYWYDEPIATFKGRIACKRNQTEWEIIRWRLNESSGVHTLELEDGTMIHMLAERR
ncbi:hypothetical protein Tco_0082325, partial [Tanacetum coccineum]